MCSTSARPVFPSDNHARLPAAPVTDHRLIRYYDQKWGSGMASFGVWYSRSLRYNK